MESEGTKVKAGSVCAFYRLQGSEGSLVCPGGAYAFSPIDLIPDPIPVLGYLDDLILIPLGIALVIRLIPAEVMQDCREKAALTMKAGKPKNWVAGGIIILIWVSLFAFTCYYLSGVFSAQRV